MFWGMTGPPGRFEQLMTATTSKEPRTAGHHVLDTEFLAELVRSSRAQQGLAPSVEEGEIIGNVIVLLGGEQLIRKMNQNDFN